MFLDLIPDKWDLLKLTLPLPLAILPKNMRHLNVSPEFPRLPQQLRLKIVVSNWIMQREICPSEWEFLFSLVIICYEEEFKSRLQKDVVIVSVENASNTWRFAYFFQEEKGAHLFVLDCCHIWRLSFPLSSLPFFVCMPSHVMGFMRYV